MPETENPVQALSAKELPVRAAAARDLALLGGPEHLALLVDRAIHDISPGVRLSCAAAAADILSRHRLGARAEAVPAAQRAELLRQACACEPGVNPGLFAVLGTLDLPAGWRRILVGLRDPRADVRAGAVVGVHRALASAAHNGDAEAVAEVVAALGDPRVRVETRADLARVAATVGLVDALPAIRALAAVEQKGVAAAAAEAQARLENPPPADGFWVDLGLDALSVDPAAAPRAWAATVGRSLIRATAAGAEVVPLAGPRRHLWLKRPGATEPDWALQVGAETWWRADADEMLALGDLLLAQARWDLLDRLDPILPHSAAGLRLRGAALLGRGAPADALLALSAATEMKKVPVDTWWFLADALHRLGRDGEARPHLERFVAKAPKRSPYMEEARRRLGPAGEGAP